MRMEQVAQMAITAAAVLAALRRWEVQFSTTDQRLLCKIALYRGIRHLEATAESVGLTSAEAFPAAEEVVGAWA